MIIFKIIKNIIIKALGHSWESLHCLRIIIIIIIIFYFLLI